MKARRDWWVFTALFAAAYALALWHWQGLRFPLERDEVHYWPTTLKFSGATWSSLVGALRSYSEPNTPLAYVIFGQVQRFTHHGLFLYRATNFTLSALILFAIAALGSDRKRSMLAALGLALCPYYIGMATHLYADMLTLSMCVAAFYLHLRRRFGWSALLWALAISTRQIAVALPAALAAWEYFALPPTAAGWLFRPFKRSWVLPAAGALSLLAWMASFGAAYPLRSTPQMRPGEQSLFPAHCLYFLVSMAVFFCLPELLLFRGAPTGGWSGYRAAGRRIAVLAVGLALAFLFFPPLRNTFPLTAPTMGYLDIAVGKVLPDVPRMVVYYLLALWTAARFALPGRRLAAWLIAFNSAVMIRTIAGWDKYDLPPLAALAMLMALGYWGAASDSDWRPFARLSAAAAQK